MNQKPSPTIVAQLRKRKDLAHYDRVLLSRAADEIEQLQAEIERLQATADAVLEINRQIVVKLRAEQETDSGL